MNLKQKVIACHGNLIAKSTALVCGCSISQVYNIWYENDLFTIKKNAHRSAPTW
ncbi:hypothetical protein [uncultured Wocania sp.]|uniref:hypothetical protein n=1 Tax=uncultured Wocania sp. TaxID=2834404 RepID=UPI0030FC2755